MYINKDRKWTTKTQPISSLFIINSASIHNNIISQKAVEFSSSSCDCNLHPTLAVACKAADEVVGSPAERNTIPARLENIGSPWGCAASVATSTHGNHVVGTWAVVEHEHITSPEPLPVGPPDRIEGPSPSTSHDVGGRLGNMKANEAQHHQKSCASNCTASSLSHNHYQCSISTKAAK